MNVIRHWFALILIAVLLPSSVASGQSPQCVVGESVDVWSSEQWYAATVTDGPDADGNCYITFDDYDSSYDQWVEPNYLRARTTSVYGVHLVGIHCQRETDRDVLHIFEPRGDDVFVIAATELEDGSSIVVQQRHEAQGVTAGEYRSTDELVWQGPAQTVVVQAMLFRSDKLRANAARTITQLGAGMAGVAIAGGTFGGAAVAGFAVGAGGVAAGEAIHRTIDADYVPLGDKQARIELRNVGDVDSQELYQAGGVFYHFVTSHQGNGAVYELFWKITD